MRILSTLNLSILLFIAHYAAAFNQEQDSLQLKKAEAEAWVSKLNSIQALRQEQPYMPMPLKMACDSLIFNLQESYFSLSDEQKSLANEEVFTGKVLSPTRNIRQYQLIKDKFEEQLNYLVYEKNWKGNGFVMLVNAAAYNRGGQKAYLVHVKSGLMLEVKVSTAWQGIGYSCDSGKTPLGYFTLNDETKNLWMANTIMTDMKDIFIRIEKQKFAGTAQWLHKVSTKKEKAYILSNQYALKGQNDGSEYVPISAPQYYYYQDSSVYWMDNLNSLERHLYVHGTNRVEQLGYALSGGCIRTSSIFSYLLKEIITRQKVIPVFIDAIPLQNAVAARYAPSFDKYDVEKTLDFRSEVTLLYERIYNDKNRCVLDKQLEKDVLEPITKLLVHDRKVKVSINMKTKVPLPEKAMIRWFELQDSLSYLVSEQFRNTFDIQSNYYAGGYVEDLAVLRRYSASDATIFVKQRLAYSKEYLLMRLEEKLKEYEIPFEKIKEQINIETPQVVEKAEDGNELTQNPFTVLDISPQRKLVLKYYEYLDSLSTANPTAFDRSELEWISSYIVERRQEKQLASENKTIIITLHDAILAQAYIYAAGEIALRKEGVETGKMKYPNDNEGFENFLALHKKPKYALIDAAGYKELYNFSYIYSKLSAKLTENMKQNNERIFGITLFGEEYFSKFKKFENRLEITVDVSLNNILLNEE
ncbi:L,D-transpeptidase [Limibacter armeniacum]|uniref:L,D-transpeptidase n=1 Tax=Limibacter armeniacum TaxID=466084 RepID=UPI002FE6C171